MMIFRCIIYAFCSTLLLMIFIACTNSRGDDISQFSVSNDDLHEINLFKIDNRILMHNDQEVKEDKIMLGRVFPYFRISPDGVFHAFRDQVFENIIVSDSTGRILYAVGGQGFGPSEFGRVQTYTVDNSGYVHAYDNSTRLIKVLGSKNDVLDTIEPYQSYHAILTLPKMFLHNDQYFFPGITLSSMGSPKTMSTSDLALIFDRQGRLIRQIGSYDDAISHSLYDNVQPVIYLEAEGNHLVAMHSNSWRIQLFDVVNSERIAWFGRQPDNFFMPQKEVRSGMPLDERMRRLENVSITHSVYLTKDYILHYYETLSSEFFTTRNHLDKIHSIAVYSRESYKYLGEKHLPGILGSLELPNKLHIVMNDDPDNFTIGTYSFHIK